MLVRAKSDHAPRPAASHIPPGFASASNTTGRMPCSSSAFAAARPLGPVPSTATSGGVIGVSLCVNLASSPGLSSSSSPGLSRGPIPAPRDQPADDEEVAPPSVNVQAFGYWSAQLKDFITGVLTSYS